MEKKVEILNSQPCQITFNVEIPREEVEQAEEITYQSLQSQVSIPGFRRGKAPLEKVKKQFVTQARNEMVEQLVARSVSEIIEERKLKPIVLPAVSELKFQFGEPCVFRLVVERSPEFEAEEYKKIVLEKKIKKITEKEVKKVVFSLQERNAYLVESTEEEAKKEHYLIVDYEVFLDKGSTPYESLKNQLFDLSQPDLIPGLIEQITGAKKGELKEVKITFPKDYPKKELVGKEAIMKIKINALKEKKLPPVNDDFARDLNFTSLEGMEAKIKENLEKLEEERIKRELRNQITDHLIKKNPLPLPSSLVEKELQIILEELYKFYQAQKLNDLWEKNFSQLKDRYRPEAERRVHLSLVLLAIAEKEKIEPEEEKIFDFLIKNAKIKEVNAKSQN